MMKGISLPQMMLCFGILIAQCTSARETSLSSREFISQLMSKNKMDRYNSQVSRMRRASQPLLPPSSKSGTNFVVGRCSIHNFFEKAKNCSKEFYAQTRKKGSTRKQCGLKFSGFRRCLRETFRNCMKGSLVSSFLTAADEAQIEKNFLILLGNEKFWCEKGGLGIASEYLPIGTACNPMFLHVSEGCTSTYTRLFNLSSTSNERLCREYQKAKKCFLHAMMQYCWFDRVPNQILEIVIEISADFQPFCKSNARQEILKFEDLFVTKTCPPHSLSDVAFLLDVTNTTTAKEFMAMKRIIGVLLNKMDYGWNGIYVAVYHYDVQLRAALKFGRTKSKGLLHRLLRRMDRSSVKGKSKKERRTGRALSSLARNAFSPHKQAQTIVRKPTKSGRRPYNGALAFVLTTGPSNDSMIRGLNELSERDVHVVFAGPSSVEIPTTVSKQGDRGARKRIDTSFKFKEIQDVVSAMTEEICIADEERRKQAQAILQEGIQQKSNWTQAQNHLRRLQVYDLSLLFDLKPFLQAFREPPTIPTITPIEEFNVLEERSEEAFLTEYSDGMDGDINYKGNMFPVDAESNQSPTTDYPGRWPYFDLEEYPVFGM